MANLQEEQLLRELAGIVSTILSDGYKQEMAFMLVATPFGLDNNSVSDYIGNMARGSSIELLRELADRLEKNQDIPASVGGVN